MIFGLSLIGLRGVRTVGIMGDMARDAEKVKRGEKTRDDFEKDYPEFKKQGEKK